MLHIDHCRECPAAQLKNQPQVRDLMKRLDRPLTWVEATGLYPEPFDCLAAYLVASAAEVLAGAKPANLIRMQKGDMPCGRSIYKLWREFGSEALEGTVLSSLVLREEADAIVFLIYRPELLQKRLAGRTMQTLLKRFDYADPSCLNSALNQLRERFSSLDSPDEVGMFLGYPAKDVYGFMHQRSNPWQGRCLWRIYGPHKRSLRLYEHYYQVRKALTDKILSGTSPHHLLMAA